MTITTTTAKAGRNPDAAPTRLRPRDLVIRPVRLEDEALLDIFLGEERLRDLGESGYTAHEEIHPKDLVTYIDSGLLRGWIIELPGHGPVSLQMFSPMGIRGVWSGECINAKAGRGVPGLGTAAMALALDRLFAEPEVHRLMGFVAVTNPPSLRMCEKLGYTREGLARQQLPYAEDVWVDAVVMGMLRAEWQGAARFDEDEVTAAPEHRPAPIPDQTR